LKNKINDARVNDADPNPADVNKGNENVNISQLFSVTADDHPLADNDGKITLGASPSAMSGNAPKANLEIKADVYNEIKSKIKRDEASGITHTTDVEIIQMLKDAMPKKPDRNQDGLSHLQVLKSHSRLC